MSKSDIDNDMVRQLAELLDETGLTEIEFGKGDWHIRIAKSGTVVQAQAPVAAPPAAPVAVVAPEVAAVNPGTIKSPMVGVAYLTPEPDTPNFVAVGDSVTEGQTIMLIEAMKVFNPIHAPKAGKVIQIIAENGSPVEFGEPLMIIE
ncbi:MAG: acetyl-CoA carboxylase biotin carboxyl carrier protein [Alphaproteobacteria bacterium]|nr:acetyl-CoA carboxylase biotin carboxyl carrier protein [Rhodospirillales bacterium]MCW9045462.1 acetyl-CoA carboxylase biotin carboxyl carrier protein [Alphaproteobacteria bacterium]